MIEIPPTLFRAFEKEEYALALIRGEVRVGLLEYYRSVKGPRRDKQEGRAHLILEKKGPQEIHDLQTRQVVGTAPSDINVDYAGQLTTPYYILCTMHPDVPQPARLKFGRYVVRIESKPFLERIHEAWKNHSWSSVSQAFIAPVEYNKGEMVDLDDNFEPPPQYFYSQKPRYSPEGEPYFEEREYRFVLPCTPEVRKIVTPHLTLEIGDCRDICSLMPAEVETESRP
jgi:hypothetical protein